jgi:hypothetical protein
VAWTTAVTRSTGYAVPASVWNGEHVDNMNFLKEVAYATFTSSASITATTSATASLVVSSGAITYQAVPHLIVFEAPGAEPDTGAIGRQLLIGIYDNGAANGVAQIAKIRTPVSGASWIQAVSRSWRVTPTAASHTYEIRAYTTAGTATIYAGANGNDVLANGYIRVYRLPT